MHQSPAIEASELAAYAEAKNGKACDRHLGGSEVAVPDRINASGKSAAKPTETIEATEAVWQFRDLRACAGIVLVFQVIYLTADWSWIGPRHEAILPCTSSIF
jgi:hypothetical protein